MDTEKTVFGRDTDPQWNGMSLQNVKSYKYLGANGSLEPWSISQTRPGCIGVLEAFYFVR